MNAQVEQEIPSMVAESGMTDAFCTVAGVPAGPRARTLPRAR